MEEVNMSLLEFFKRVTLEQEISRRFKNLNADERGELTSRYRDLIETTNKASDSSLTKLNPNAVYVEFLVAAHNAYQADKVKSRDMSGSFDTRHHPEDAMNRSFNSRQR